MCKRRANSKYVRARIAVSTKYKGEKKDVWHRVTFFGSLCDVVTKFMNVGSGIYVECSLDYPKFTDKEGKERYGVSLVARNLEFLVGSNNKAKEGDGPAGNKAGGESSGNGGEDSFNDQDDVPF